MMGHSLAKLLIQVFGYAWPAYQCYKAIESSHSTSDAGLGDLRDWCIYWFTIAVFITAERGLNLFVSWLPLYNEAKLLFVIWLWHPRTKGAVVLYHSTLQPLLSQHEATIDNQLSDIQGLMTSAFQNHSGSVVQFLKDKISFLISKAQEISNKAPNNCQPGANGGSVPTGGMGQQGHGWLGDLASAAAERMAGNGNGSNANGGGARHRTDRRH